MAFSSLSENSRIRILLLLEGGAKYVAEMDAASIATRKLAIAQNLAARSALGLTRRTFAQNQVLFTGRRVLFAAAIATLAAGAAAVKMGFSYQSSMQQARVALEKVLRPQSALNTELNQLFRLAALSPFQFKDIVSSFTVMYKSAMLSGRGVQFVNRVLRNVADALSAVPGKATAANLNRVTTAIQHMINLGRPMGQQIQQLGRLGIPIEAILKKQLNLTDDQIRHISTTGITAIQVLEAFNKFIESSPGFRGQALATQTKTLAGAWSSFKDFLSQAMGGGTTGTFSFLQKALSGVDNKLNAITKSGKAATLTNVVDAWDKQLSPNTHLVINLFLTLEYTLKTVIGSFYLMLKVIQLLLRPFDVILSLFDANRFAAKALGIVLGLLATVWLSQKIVLISIAFWHEVIVVRMYAMTVASKVAAAASALYTMWLMREAYAMEAVAIATRIATAAQWLFNFAVSANPYVILAEAIILLVILYFRWDRFHRLVNKTFNFFRESAPWIRLWMDMFAPLVGIIDRVATLVRMLQQLKHALEHPSGGGFLSWAARRITHTLIPTTQIPFVGKYTDPFYYAHKRASGGITSGMTMVGEHGPEIAAFPGGTRIFSHSQSGAMQFGDNMPAIKVYVFPQDIRLNGEKIGSVVSKATTDKEARL